MRIEVATIVGPSAMTLTDGNAVYAVIMPLLSRGEVVELDFSGVHVFASPFFNAAIGQLLASVQSSTLNALLKILNLAAPGDRLVRDVIRNAKRFYQLSAEDRSTAGKIDDDSSGSAQ